MIVHFQFQIKSLTDSGLSYSQKFVVFYLLLFSMQGAKRNLVYPRYAWLLYSWYTELWWTEKDAGEILEGCSDEVLAEFLLKARAFVIYRRPEIDDIDEQTFSGLVKSTIARSTFNCVMSASVIYIAIAV